MINPIKLPPFKHFCVTIGNLPTSYVDSLSYYEMLEWLCHYLQDTVIPALNQTSEAVSELQSLYVELKNYVDNYFENLDVQEEINNKLDDMAEDGTLDEMITAYIQLKSVLAYNNISEMKEATNLVNGSFVKTYGFYSANDGGGCYYRVRNITNADTVDEVTLIALADENLVAELILFTGMNVECFGAYGDNDHDDSSSIIKALTTVKNITFMANKNYAIKNTIEVGSNYLINGNNCLITLYSGKTAFDIKGNNTIIENFRITKSGTNYYGININSTYTNNKIYNIYGENLTYSLIMNDGINSLIENCYAYMCGWDCVSNYAHAKNGVIKNCVAIKCGRHGFSCDVGCENLVIENCYAENIGYITGEGHSSFHLEGGKECTIRNCHAVYDTNHLKFSETFTGILTACRVEGSYTNYIDGLKIDISGSFSSADLFPMYFNSTSIPNVYLKNINIKSSNTNLLNIYLSNTYLYIDNSIFSGLVRFRQVGVEGIIKKLNNCLIDMTSNTESTFYQARYKADGLIATNNLITNSKNLIEGRVLNSIIKNNTFKSCNESVYLTQAENNSADKSQNVTFSNNVIDGCTIGVHLGWASDEKIYLFDNLFKGVIDTVLLGSYVAVHAFDNKQQNLTYTTLKTNVTISTADDSLVF